MPSFTVKVEGGMQPGVLQRVQAAMLPEAIDPVVDRVAARTWREVVEATPKRWFGQVRKSWQVEKPAVGARIVANDNKIMWFLEEGTRAHGPRGSTVQTGGFSAKGPINRVTGNIALRPRGVTFQRPIQKRVARRLYIPLNRKAAMGWQPGLQYGRDYILAKWVRGIEARHIAARQALKSEAYLLDAMRDHLRRAVTA